MGLIQKQAIHSSGRFWQKIGQKNLLSNYSKQMRVENLIFLIKF